MQFPFMNAKVCNCKLNNSSFKYFSKCDYFNICLCDLLTFYYHNIIPTTYQCNVARKRTILMNINVYIFIYIYESLKEYVFLYPQDVVIYC